MPFFGFTPSEGLLNDIQTGIANKNSSEPLYPLRDKIALQLNEEIIDNVLIQLVQHFPASEKRDTAEKLAGYVKSTVAVLLKQFYAVLRDLQEEPAEVLETAFIIYPHSFQDFDDYLSYVALLQTFLEKNQLTIANIDHLIFHPSYQMTSILLHEKGLMKPNT